MPSEEKQPVGIFLSLFFKVLISVIFICLTNVLVDPFFVAYKAENMELIIIAFVIFLIFTKMKVQHDPELYARRRMELQNPSLKKPLSARHIIVRSVLIIGFFLLLFKSSQVNIANHIPEFRDMAIPAMQQECAKNCAAYGVTQNSLIGPRTEHSFCCTDKSGTTNFLFSWHSNSPDVTLKIRIKGTRYPLTITHYWIGNPTSSNSVNPTSSQEAISTKTTQEPVKPTRTDIQSVIQQNQDIIDAAYHHALKVTPSMHGHYLAMQLTIKPDGHVSSVQVMSTDLNSTDLRNNLLNIFRNLKFSSGNFNIMILTYRLNL